MRALLVILLMQGLHKKCAHVQARHKSRSGLSSSRRASRKQRRARSASNLQARTVQRLLRLLVVRLLGRLCPVGPCLPRQTGSPSLAHSQMLRPSHQHQQVSKQALCSRMQQGSQLLQHPCNLLKDSRRGPTRHLRSRQRHSSHCRRSSLVQALETHRLLGSHTQKGTLQHRLPRRGPQQAALKARRLEGKRRRVALRPRSLRCCTLRNAARRTRRWANFLVMSTLTYSSHCSSAGPVLKELGN